MKGYREGLMEYRITSGRTVEIVRVRMRVRQDGALPTRRGMRVRGKTSLKKILRNENESVKNLARLINCNFGRGDLFVTLKYDNAHLPADREGAEAVLTAFLRKLKSKSGKAPSVGSADSSPIAAQQGSQALSVGSADSSPIAAQQGSQALSVASRQLPQGGSQAPGGEGREKFRYIKATAVRDSESGESVRLHHHLLLPAGCEELIYALWVCPDAVSIRRLDGSGDYTSVARYIIQNTDTGEKGGKPRYSPSRNLDKPVYTEPVPCRLNDRVRIPRDASLKEKSRIENEETGQQSLYVRYTKAATSSAAAAAPSPKGKAGGERRKE